MQFTVTSALLFTVASLNAQVFARPTPQDYCDYDYDYGYYDGTYDSAIPAYGYDYDRYGYGYDRPSFQYDSYSSAAVPVSETGYPYNTNPAAQATSEQSVTIDSPPRNEVAMEFDRTVVRNDRFQTPTGSSSPLSGSGIGVNNGAFGLFNSQNQNDGGFVPDFSNLFPSEDPVTTVDYNTISEPSRGTATYAAPTYRAPAGVPVSGLDRTVAAGDRRNIRAADGYMDSDALRNDGHEQFNDQTGMARNDIDDGAAAQFINRNGAVGARRCHNEAGSFELLFGFDKGCKYDKGFGYTRSYGEDYLHDDIAEYAGLDNRVANRLGSSHRDGVITTAMDEADTIHRYGDVLGAIDAVNAVNANEQGAFGATTGLVGGGLNV